MTLEEFKIIDASTLPVGKLITMASRGHTIYINHKLEGLNINGTQLHLLFEIAHQTNINQEKIATRCNINKGAVARSIKKLEEKQLITRQIDENNRRQNIISLTSKGKETLNEANKILNTWESEVFDNYTKEEKNRLQKDLKDIVIKIIEINQREIFND